MKIDLSNKTAFVTGGTKGIGKAIVEALVECGASVGIMARGEKDLQGPESGNNHSVRGGSWHTSATSWRSIFRKPYAPAYRGISIGFRVVMEKSFNPLPDKDLI